MHTCESNHKKTKLRALALHVEKGITTRQKVEVLWLYLVKMPNQKGI
jgi:hypothetical protein